MSRARQDKPSKNGKPDFQRFVSHLENMILTGAFKPRERLVEATLAEMFAVSRYWVRDAFKVLETKGLVTVTPFKGVTVYELGRQEIEEIFVVRLALEQLSLRLAMENATAGDLNILRELIVRIEAANREENFAAMVEADTLFHDHIFQMSRNGNLCRMINDLRNRCHITRFAAWSSPHIVQRVIAEHRKILEAIESRNERQLNELAEKHISHGKEAYLHRLRAETTFLT